MRRAVVLIALSCMALAAGTSRALADVGVIAFSGQSGVELSALYDPDGARVSGVSLGGFGDVNEIGGIGLSLSADYQRLRGAAGAADFHSAAVALGLRVSALALASRREEIRRWFDASAGAGFEGGLAARNGTVQGRGSVWLEAGVTARLGVTTRSPGLGIHYRRRMAREPEPLPEHMLMLTLSLTWTRTGLARYH
jgi:hypothetical protein